MKVLTPHPEKCQGAFACVKACAKALNKKDDLAHSAIRPRKTAQGFSFTVCNQCGECIEVCPTGALRRNKAGTVLIQRDLCVGCLMCIGFCPHKAMFRVPGTATPFKCTSCGSCVKACPHGALSLETQDHATLPA
jgi:Fe-S-cluster-containing hydrogenase component 2